MSEAAYDETRHQLSYISYVTTGDKDLLILSNYQPCAVSVHPFTSNVYRAPGFLWALVETWLKKSCLSSCHMYSYNTIPHHFNWLGHFWIFLHRKSLQLGGLELGAEWNLQICFIWPSNNWPAKWFFKNYLQTLKNRKLQIFFKIWISDFSWKIRRSNHLAQPTLSKAD